ncbi:MAG: CpaD family pilus assembly lipoprotein [Alphaproteobacteria bacterium]|nr:CpaD family pilus assembly lipoprotein [Alphaproteobacteria bacterium]
MKNSRYILILPVLVVLLAGCTQTTPSMMNTSRIESIQGSTIEQIPLADLDEASIAVIAEQHRRYGTGPLDLTMTFDPKSKDFTAMKAIQTTKTIQESLKQKGVPHSSVQTMAVSEGTPSLIVTYDTVQVQAPSDCAPMPGLTNYDTTRFIEEYKFGCGVETMMAKQIARPKDLTGNAELDTRGGRRESVVTDGYSAGVPREPLQGLERENLSTN